MNKTFQNNHNNCGGIKLSEKELMYIEDALSHMVVINDAACSIKEDVSDDACKLLEKLIDKNNKIYSGFYKLLK